jgi:hypothetical protein
MPALNSHYQIADCYFAGHTRLVLRFFVRPLNEIDRAAIVAEERATKHQQYPPVIRGGTLRSIFRVVRGKGDRWSVYEVEYSGMNGSAGSARYARHPALPTMLPWPLAAPCRWAEVIMGALIEADKVARAADIKSLASSDSAAEAKASNAKRQTAFATSTHSRSSERMRIGLPPISISPALETAVAGRRSLPARASAGAGRSAAK